MQESRILRITDTPFSGEAVLYVMSRDQRVNDNQALLTAAEIAGQHGVPVIVMFTTRHVTLRRREHYQFMLDGLEEVAANLKELNIPFIMRIGDATEEIVSVASEINAGLVVFDFSPLVGPRRIVKDVAAQLDCATWVVDTHNIIPLWVASDKKEFAAHTMRGKVHKFLEHYIKEPGRLVPQTIAFDKDIVSASFDEAREYIQQIPLAGITVAAKPGEAAAAAHLATFLETGLLNYALQRNNIADDQQSGLSPYLHFGQISAIRVALDTLRFVNQRPLLFDEGKLASHGEEPSLWDGMNALFEEMIVRKELADNFCFYEQDYKSLTAGPDWAQKSLQQHAGDPREFTYSRQQWEDAQTHDLSWNASQNQLRKTGKIHGYMRMYWAKKILEWSATPEEAMETCLYLNDTYSIDGADPNGYVGILWSLVGVHDRPWFERDVFGKIRYMNEGGLMRKYDVAAYHKQWNG